MSNEKLINFLFEISQKPEQKQCIDCLVDIITDNGKGRIALNSTVKDLLLSDKNNNYHRETIRILVNEFCTFGGGTLRNMVKSQPSYSEILNDIYKELKGNNFHLSDDEKELFIVQKQYGDEFEKYFKSNNLEKEYSVWKNLRWDTTLGLLFVTRANLPTGILTNIYALQKPALRVIVPFISIVSLLKIMQKHHSITKEQESTALAEYPINHNGNKLFDIALFDKFYQPTKKSVKIDDTNIISQVSQIFSTLPSIATTQELKNGNYVISSISLDQLKPSADGSGYRGMIIKDRIQEHTILNAPEKLQNLVNAGMAFNILSTVVAQKHLAEINQKLTEIKDGIKDIKDFLESQEESFIDAYLEDAKDLLQSLKNNKNIDNEINVINSSRMQIVAVHNRLKGKVLELSGQLAQFDANRSDKFRRKLLELNTKIMRYNKPYFMSLYAVAISYQIYQIYFERKNEMDQVEIYQEKLEKLAKDSKHFIEEHLLNINKEIRENAKKKTFTWDQKNTIEANRVLIQNRLSESFELLQQSYQYVESQLVYKEPETLDLLLSFENNQLTEISVLS